MSFNVVFLLVLRKKSFESCKFIEIVGIGVISVVGDDS